MVIKVDMNNTLFRNASPPLTDWTPILISIAIILIALLILWIVWGYLKEWLKSQLQGATSSNATPTDFIQGQWCFVGEDLTGRWCVKTPEEGLCPKQRVFQSRSECEMKTASASPLGINQHHDTTMIPIAGLSIA
jgi:hypothetical protein